MIVQPGLWDDERRAILHDQIQQHRFGNRVRAVHTTRPCVLHWRTITPRRGGSRMLRKGIGRAAAIAAASVLLIVVPGAAHLPSAHADAGNYFDDCPYDWLHCGTGAQVDLTSDQVRARTDFCLWDNNGSSHPNAAVCIKRDEDVVFVRDTDSDGRSALGQIGFTAANIYVCRNAHGFGTWARCDFQWPENNARLRTADCDFDNAPISFGSSECTRSERYIDFVG